MKYLFTLCLLIVSLSGISQWQQTGARVRYVNGLGIPTRDTVAGVLADSSQILIRPADSSLYVKYKRTWLRVGGGGGSIAGSGTTNYIPKFTSSTAIGNSQIFDNGTSVGIGTASPAYKLDVNGAILSTTSLYKNSAGTNVLNVAADDQQYGGSSSDGGIFVYGNNKLFLSTNSTRQVTITGGGNVGIGTTSPTGRFVVADGQTLLGTNTDNGTDRLQVSGSASVTSLLGVGTSPSAGTVHIKTTSPSIAIDDNDNAGTAAIRFRPQSASFLTRGSIELVSTGSAAPTRFVIASTDTMTFRTNNVERMRVTSAGGNVLISTTTDNNADKLQVNGSIQGTGFNQAYTARTSTYTAATNDYFIDCTSGTFTVNLFTAVGNTGRILIIKNSGTGTITVDPNGSQTIDGATTQTLSTQWSRVHIISDGANWKIISN